MEIEVFLMPAWFPGAVEVGGLIVAEGGPVGPAGDEALLVVRAAVVVLSVAGQGQVAAQQPELGHRDQTWSHRLARYSDKLGAQEIHKKVILKTVPLLIYIFIE